MPKCFSGSIENQIGLPRGVTLPALEDFTQSEIWPWPQHKVNVVRHHDPVIEQIVLTVKMSERVRHHVRDLGMTQVTFARALVEVTLNLAAEFTMDFLRLLARCLGRNTFQAFGTFALELEQNSFRQ